jgi:hypothetical protein
MARGRPRKLAVPPKDSSGATLFLPEGALKDSDSRRGRSLPPDLRELAARRIRLIAIVYSLAFFLADIVPNVVMRNLGERFQRPSEWMPTTFSIAGGLLVATFITSPRLGWEAKVNLGLLFQVAASIGIALSQYLSLPELASMPVVYFVLSPSWVGIWMLFYSIVVPAPPRRALVALVASALVSPAVIWLVLQQAKLLHLIPPGAFFLSHVFPYLIVAGMAYAGSRIVFKLSGDVSRARELGSYRLIERLGQGGMGEVWRASHNLLARAAAIKFIRPETITGSDPEAARLMLKRFELEAQATASLTSEHTVALYDFGVTDEGTFYYVMELLDGLDCDRLVRRFGPLPPARVIHLLTQVCESLEEAHARGLIHRDVKPANVYVCRNGNRVDFVKVLDFGLVADRREQTTRTTPDLRLTQPDQAIGTPEFMPPEIVLGHAIDGRTDLYALGCVGYWLATGHSAFEGGSFYEVVSKHLHVTPDPPSQHAPNGMPAELEALILECLEKDPDRRPTDARVVRERLGVIALDQPWPERDAQTWWSANLAIRPFHRTASSSP